jgi:hypothetical protein
MAATFLRAHLSHSKVAPLNVRPQVVHVRWILQHVEHVSE